jgi:hypothetical protein
MSIRSPEDSPRFAHDRLDAYGVAREARILSDAISRALPRGYGPLAGPTASSASTSGGGTRLARTGRVDGLAPRSAARGRRFTVRRGSLLPS